MCRTVSCVTQIVPDESSDMSETDTAEIEESDIEGFCLWPDLWNEEDSSVSSVGLNIFYFKRKRITNKCPVLDRVWTLVNACRSRII